MSSFAILGPRLANALRVQRRIIGALILRDMKTRFGRSHIGYLIAVAWPLSHMLGIMGVQYVVGRVVPIGTDLAVFAATGLLPYILCIYPARQMMTAIAINQPLLLFSLVKTTDMIIARATLEVLTACVVGMVFLLILYSSDVDLEPIDSAEAIMAVLTSIYLGVCIGIVNTIMYGLFQIVWLVIFILFAILLYGTSGALILSTSLPAAVRDVLWYNPLYQCVEWLRSAYYDGYAGSPVSRIYVLCFATFCLFLGVVGERVFRGRLYLR